MWVVVPRVWLDEIDARIDPTVQDGLGMFLLLNPFKLIHPRGSNDELVS